MIYRKEGAEAIAFKCHSHIYGMLHMLHISALHLPLLRTANRAHVQRNLEWAAEGWSIRL
jgi:hypothetical protein